MTASASRQDDLRSLIDDVWRARYADSRFGHEDFSQFPALIVRADEIGDLYWQFKTRLEAVYAAIWTGTATDVLTLSAWLLKALDRHGDELDVDDADLMLLNTTLADFLESVAHVPEITLAQAAAVIDDVERRVAGTAFASHVMIASARAAVEIQRGAPDAARELLDGITDFSPPTGTCEEGGRTTVAQLYCDIGEFTRALEISEPDLVDDGSRCGFFPAETYSGLVSAYAATGRTADVIRAAESVDAVYGEFPGLNSTTSSIVALLRVGESSRAQKLAWSRLPYLGRQFTPLAEAELSAAIAATLASGTEADPDLVVLWRDDPRRPAAPRPAVDVVDLLADRAREIAKRYDARNANSVVSEKIEEVLALRVSAPLGEAGTPVARRDAAGLLSGISSFAPVSPRLNAACAAGLRERVDELTARDQARVRHVLAWERRREDPMLAIEELEAAAAETDADHPAWAAQSRLLAGLAKVELGLAEPESVRTFGPPSPEWPVLAQASIWRALAMAVAPADLSLAEGHLARGLDLISRAERGELPYGEERSPDDPYAGSLVADGHSVAVTLHHLRANLLVGREADPGPAVDAALVSARQAYAAASTPDQEMRTRGELTEALSLAARRQLDVDPAGTLLLMNEAVENARYAQRGAMLDIRWELRMETGDVEGAHEDCEQALAVWTVEGMDFEADEETFHLGRVKLFRGDDPRAVIDLVRPAIERMESRGAQDSVDTGVQILAAAQAEAGFADEAVVSFTALIDGLDGVEHPAYEADLRRRRGLAYRSLQRTAEALADFDAATELLVLVGDRPGAVEALRTAALTAFFDGVETDALVLLDRADLLLAEVSDGVLDFDQARVDLARADIVREGDPAAAKELLASIADRARAANWTPLLLVALMFGAEVELAADRPDAREKARELVDEGLRVDPEHPGLRHLDDEIG